MTVLKSDLAMGTPSGAGAQILVLVHDPVCSAQLETALTSHGYVVTCLSAAGDALPDIDYGSYHCVFLDQHFGELDCVSLVSEIRRYHSLEKLPVVFIADGDSYVCCSEVLRAGANIELCVPWDENMLLAKLDVQLRISQAYRQLETNLLDNMRRNAELVADLNLGQQVQESFLPPSQLRTDNFMLEARLYAGGDLSGDYFDYALLSQQRLIIFLADVSGHGIASALLANRLKAFFDENTRTAHRPRLFLERLNKVILDLGDHYHIATAVCVHIDIAETVLTYASAGHRTMYLLDGDQGYAELPTTGPALGMFKEFEINEIHRSFMPGCNRLVTYTDGLVEFKMPDDAWITEERFRDEVMLPNAQMKLDAYVMKLLESSRSMTGKKEWDDDVSLLAVDF